VISKLIKDRASREAYIGAKLKVLIPSQIRALRLRSNTPRQEDLANAAAMKQSRISAMETPGTVNFNLETLVRIASALKVGLTVKFVSFSEMLEWENGFSQDEFNPVTIDNDAEFARQQMAPAARRESEIIDAEIVEASASEAGTLPKSLLMWLVMPQETPAQAFLEPMQKLLEGGGRQAYIAPTPACTETQRIGGAYAAVCGNAR
jgi:transcriptional regulator with XRE-family HTH domain